MMTKEQREAVEKTIAELFALAQRYVVAHERIAKVEEERLAMERENHMVRRDRK